MSRKDKSEGQTDDKCTKTFGGVELTGEQLNQLIFGTHPKNEDGKVVINYIDELLPTFNQESYNEFNLTGIVPFASKYNLSQFMQEIQENWSPEGCLEFNKIEYDTPEDVIQVALCPNLIENNKLGFADTHGNRGIANGLTGSQICLYNNDKSTFSHEIGHALGINHPDKVDGVSKNFNDAGINVNYSSIMFSLEKDTTPDWPTQFDQDLFRYSTINECFPSPTMPPTMSLALIGAIAALASTVGLCAIGLTCGAIKRSRNNTIPEATVTVQENHDVTDLEGGHDTHVSRVTQTPSPVESGRNGGI